ncbi:MAG: NAD(P)-dependent oxidoreductase [Candidatus Methanoperedens sp.]|nr:NAD(P)-dependent oxidoreductase [Candidatus Methanoperedens sp.]
MRKKIAILGATGHIAKSLIYGFCLTDNYELLLFARSNDRLNEFLQRIHCNNRFSYRAFSEFEQEKYDVVINCIGIGDPGKLKNAGISIFRLTETYDNMILDYIEDQNDALYINFSSGAAYGTYFSIPADESSCAKIYINNLASTDYYGIAKLNAEAKHRSLNNLNIIDLRIFGYFSRFIDIGSQYLLSEAISCIQDGKVLETGPGNIIRDYVHPQDFMSLIEKCINKRSINDVFDVYSKKPVTKFEILDYFTRQYGLRYIVKENANISNATGTKDNYYSNNKKAEKLCYFPRFTSLDSIIDETKLILSNTI